MSTATTTDEKQPIPNQVFVGGMTPETSIQQLTKHFESLKLQPAGPPTFFQTPDGVSKGCALVPFATPEAQAAAITALSGSKLGEQALVARPDRGPRRVRREVNQDGTYLYVGNLDPDVTVTELHELFAPEGKLTYCNISRKRRSERSLGWATVRLNSDEAAQKAQESLNGKTFKERVLTVEPLKSIPRPARKPRVRKEREPRDPNLPALENVEQPAADPCVVWVGNLPFTTTEDTLRPLFAESGEVKDVVITRDKRSKESRGWGTVTFATPEAAAAAVSKLNGTTFEERAMNVQIRRGPRVYGDANLLKQQPTRKRQIRNKRRSRVAAAPAASVNLAATEKKSPSGNAAVRENRTKARVKLKIHKLVVRKARDDDQELVVPATTPKRTTKRPQPFMSMLKEVNNNKRADAAVVADQSPLMEKPVTMPVKINRPNPAVSAKNRIASWTIPLAISTLEMCLLPRLLMI
jgi:RNA recognition motif-containing protein